MRPFLGLILASCLATPVFAQVYPEPLSTTVNDYADMLGDEAEARIAERLDALAEDGPQITVVTLSSVQFYANDTEIDAYAAGLFNEWGIGDADANDGVLLLIFRDDRMLRIGTGAGYSDAEAAAARTVIDYVIVPEFSDGNFEDGIEKGVQALINVVDPNAIPTEPDSSGEGGGNILWYILGGVVVIVGGIVGLNRRATAKLAATPCPNCGKTGTLSKERETLEAATVDHEGRGEKRTVCSACGHVEAEQYAIARLKPETEPGFEGGGTKGDGATGKW